MSVEHDKFSFFMPLDVAKAAADGAEMPDPDGGSKRVIQGIASTESQDLQGEVVLKKGIDTSYFIKHGFINDDHRPVYVGEPLEANITPAGLWIKAMLYGECSHKSEIANCSSCRADYWWALTNSLDRAKSSGGRRRVGFSIEGQIQRRDGNVIEKCWLKNIAITASPINTDTFAEVAKSLSAQPWCEIPGNENDPSCGCGCGTCSTSREITEKSVKDAMTYPQTLEWLLINTKWTPIVSLVVAKALHRNHAAR